MRRTSFLFILLLLSPLAAAGDATSPELSDPQGDQQETEPGLGDTSGVGTDHDFSDTDILAAWFAEPQSGTLTVTVQTAADLMDNTDIALSFAVSPGPTSVFGSTADASVHDFAATGSTLTTGPGTVTIDGATATFQFTRADVGASGGDLLSDLTVSTTRSEAAPDTCPVLCEDQTGSDDAPGPALNYTVDRPAIAPGADLGLLGGTATETHNGSTVATPFVGDEVTVTDANATVTFDLRLTNTGTDADRYAITVLGTGPLADRNITAGISQVQVDLAPGNATDLRLSVALLGAPVGTHTISVAAASERDANAVATATIVVAAPPTPTPTPSPAPVPAAAPVDEGRDPLVGEGTFLQDAAEGMGLDGLFGDNAEAALLAAALLLLILILFLVFILAGSAWVKVTITPKSATVGAGETAEFHIEVHNKKRRYHEALAYFEGLADWKTGVMLKPEEGRPPRPLTAVGEEAEFSIGGRDEPGDHLTGTLRVQAPKDMEKGKDAVTLNIVPLGKDGDRIKRHAGHAKVKVHAQQDAPGPEGAASPQPGGSGPTVRMSRVEHEPSQPAPGEMVTTTATVENDSGDETLRLRVVLQLDGSDLEEETVEIPPRSARAVRFPWRAGDGPNRVRVQVYLA